MAEQMTSFLPPPATTVCERTMKGRRRRKRSLIFCWQRRPDDAHALPSLDPTLVSDSVAHLPVLIHHESNHHHSDPLDVPREGPDQHERAAILLAKRYTFPAARDQGNVSMTSKKRSSYRRLWSVLSRRSTRLDQTSINEKTSLEPPTTYRRASSLRNALDRMLRRQSSGQKIFMIPRDGSEWYSCEDESDANQRDSTSLDAPVTKTTSHPGLTSTASSLTPYAPDGKSTNGGGASAPESPCSLGVIHKDTHWGHHHDLQLPVNQPCVCKWPDIHSGGVYDAAIPINRPPDAERLGTYEEALVHATSICGNWITILDRSDSLDPQMQHIGLNKLKRTVMNRLQVQFVAQLENNNTVLHSWICTPLGPKHMHASLIGEEMVDDDNEVGRWAGVAKMVDFSRPWFCQGRPVRALQLKRTNHLFGEAFETRVVLPDEKEGVILLFNIMLYPVDPRKRPIIVDRILKRA